MPYSGTMTADLAIILGLLCAAVVMFAVNRPRMDAVALLMMTALPLTGIIAVDEALRGFADPNIVLIAALFVIGEGLVRTGVARAFGDWLAAHAGHSEARLVALLMVVVTGIGSFMSSTGVVAIFIPVVLRIARNARIAPGRLMMPLSVAALTSGMMTLIATAPNLIVNGEMTRRGLEGFHFFSFTPFGLGVLALGVAYMLVARRWLPTETAAAAGPGKPKLAEWVEEYGLAAHEHRLRVTAGSPFCGRTLAELDLRASSGVHVIGIERASRFASQLLQPTAATRLKAGDVLLIDLVEREGNIDAIVARYALARLPLSGTYFSDRAQDIGMAELMIPATSRLIGMSPVEARFRSETDLAIVGLKRGREAHRGALAHEKLKLGDTLLVAGPWRAIRRVMQDRRDLVVLSLPAEEEDVVPVPSRAPHALFALLTTVGLMVTGAVPDVQAALIGCLLMGLFGCIDMPGAYRAIHWQTLLLIVGMLPFSLALQRTGGVDLAAGALLGLAGEAGPRLVLAGLFAATALLGLFISNTATAVLMAPVALAIADALGASPYPFAMTVALAASTAFMTPVSSPVNTLVVGPGNYRFLDFVRIGVPLALAVMAFAVAAVPLIFPLYP